MTTAPAWPRDAADRPQAPGHRVRPPATARASPSATRCSRCWRRTTRCCRRPRRARRRPASGGRAMPSLCAPWSSAGVPSISLPTAVTASGLPLALQLVQAPSGLARLLGVAAVVREGARLRRAPEGLTCWISRSRAPTVFDGTGRIRQPHRRSACGTKGHRSPSGDLSREAAGNTLNATGRVLAPGFIDMHSHFGLAAGGATGAPSPKIRQGVTTEVVGNCGLLAGAGLDGVPRRDAHVSRSTSPRAWTFALRARSASNLARLRPRRHRAQRGASPRRPGTLRLAAMGFARRPPTSGELTAMQRSAGRSHERGCPGACPPGLIYARAPTPPSRRDRGRWPARPRATAASTRANIRGERTHAAGRQSRRPYQESAARRRCRCRSATSRPPGRPYWGKCARRAGADRLPRRPPRAWT